MRLCLEAESVQMPHFIPLNRRSMLLFMPAFIKLSMMLYMLRRSGAMGKAYTIKVCLHRSTGKRARLRMAATLFNGVAVIV